MMSNLGLIKLIGIICGPLPAITNGDFNSTNREYFKYETVVTYHCNLGERRQKLFDLMGEPSIYCSSEDNQVGIWSRPPRQYIISNKCTPLVIENVINMSENKTHRCLKLSVSKYFLQLLMLQNLPLLLEGNRLLEHAVIAIAGIKVAATKKGPSIATSCAHLQVCQPPPEILHGKHTPNHKDDCSPGQEVFYSRYDLRGSASLCCTSQGDWSPADPQFLESRSKKSTCQQNMFPPKPLRKDPFLISFSDDGNLSLAFYITQGFVSVFP
ncbi:LOW QUALITY PROTEIN: complement component receptor 1-like protein [Dama dama]